MSRAPIWSAPFTATFAAHFLFSLGFWTFVHLPGFLQGLGGREAEIGMIMGALSISAIAVRPLLGRIMDSYGRRPVVLLGGAVNFIAAASYLTADSLGPWIYAIRIIHGVGEAALFSVMFTIAADVVPEGRRTEGIAIFGVSGLLPLSLGGVLGDWVLGRWDYQTLFLVSAGIGLAAMLLSLPIPETKPASDGTPHKTGLVRIFFDRGLIPLWILTLGFTLGITSYFTFLKTYIEQLQIGTVGMFFTAYSIASVGLRLLFSWVPERIGPKRALVPAVASLVLGVTLLGHAGSPAVIIAAGTFCGLGHAYVFPIISALVVTRAHADNRGQAMTMFTALFDVGALIGGPALGLVIELSSYSAMFVSTAVIVVAFTTAFFVVDR